MKSVLLLLAFQLTSPAEIQKYQEAEAVLNKTYNHTRLLEADQEAERMARVLIHKYPDDPYIYALWASAEWLLIGRELNLRADEEKDVTQVNGYKERVQRYHYFVEKGLSLTENSIDEHMLFMRATLKFDQAKFAAKYEGRYSGLRKADQAAAEGIKILKDILRSNPNFCSAYLFLGANRLQFSTKIKWYEKPFVWASSRAYGELYAFDGDVINEKKAIEWLERAYHCGYPQPWQKKAWLETSFILVGAYGDFGKKRGKKEEMDTLLKEVPLLQKIVAFFPQNKDLGQRLSQKESRLETLQNTIFKQK
ncbi:hypothetical protein A2661_03105 [Candidatus Giovannonibacteria bacterium RIFCSPHIGHO2_01_FULL_45_24]|uniref:Uncharacterized protein n=1 Tax=Candidatus Yanofskybacteria bacterium RIFCSPHIGHO2_02_FULL_43_15c TaxID=1802679 RepID=A0A1F8FHK2_9BACT|nr:MAG: hypothetical protein A2661_03105 [Candidatus Giovannonibacteria bacterium RIFCSPHIGHO2_01_FULL_45_24]OGN12070.1 MAG: hypothetical protein A3C71_02405 [Candidatus Yanofskybacteria bacterium RIFCSPHIGHO2_02_FULL_43_15c]